MFVFILIFALKVLPLIIERMFSLIALSSTEFLFKCTTKLVYNMLLFIAMLRSPTLWSLMLSISGFGEGTFRAAFAWPSFTGPEILRCGTLFYTRLSFGDSSVAGGFTMSNESWNSSSPSSCASLKMSTSSYCCHVSGFSASELWMLPLWE